MRPARYRTQALLPAPGGPDSRKETERDAPGRSSSAVEGVEIAIGVDQRRVVARVRRLLGRRQLTAPHGARNALDDHPGRLRPAAGKPRRPQRR